MYLDTGYCKSVTCSFVDFVNTGTDMIYCFHRIGIDMDVVNQHNNSQGCKFIGQIHSWMLLVRHRYSYGCC